MVTLCSGVDRVDVPDLERKAEGAGESVNHAGPMPLTPRRLRVLQLAALWLQGSGAGTIVTGQCRRRRKSG